MKGIAFVFPGQGSQTVGMGRELHRLSDCGRMTFEEADDVLGFALSRLCFEGPEDQLRLTENTQPAILVVSIAACRTIAAQGIRPEYVAGHSLGEYSALVAAGSLSFADALRTVRKRGRYMQEAVPIGQGAMAAILGMPESEVIGLCEEAACGEVLSPANLNSPSQIVIAGAAAAVNRALELAKARGVKRALLLPVSAPFHCALMEPAREKLAKELSQIRFDDPRVPVINNVDAAEIKSGSAVAESLSRQVCSPVRWTASVQRLIGCGVRLFIELGPGKVLCGLIRQIDRTIKTTNVDDGESLAAAVLLANAGS